MRNYLCLIITCLLLVSGSMHSQSQNLKEDSPTVKVISRVKSNEVRLRWAITSATAWLRANKYGYIIERYTIKRDGKQLDTAEKKIVTPVPITPKPMAEWESIIEKNDYAAILAQALYGETFQVEEMQGGIAQIINKSKEIEQRFSFALFAADLNFEAALLGGLGYIDATIKENEDYFYTIKTAIPSEVLIVKEGNVFVESSKQEELPQPIDLIAIGDDKSILLTWEYEMFKTVFTSYYLERSENGTDFKRLGDTPLVNLNDKPESPSKRMFYVDTLSQNDKTYYYRVKGISPFGEESPASKIASGQGVKKLSAVPHISKYEFDVSGGVVLQWGFEKAVENEIQGFELNWAAQEKGPYKVVQADIPSNARETIYLEPEPSNYFRITAIGKNNQKTTSLTAFVQTIDSIPPSQPQGVTGVVDSLGVVQLQWQANTEKDMLGYRVFRGNLEKEEVSQLTVAPIEQTTFTDTVQVKSLNTKVFYQIVAVDKRFNMSDYSEKLALKKPDVVPPSSPIFSGYKVKEEGVQLQWINSSSEDVKHHKLYRQQVAIADKGWQVIYQTDTISKFVDNKVVTGQKYRYAIFAEDESGLTSIPSTPLTLTIQKNKPIQVVKNFTGLADRIGYKIDLSWKITNDNVSEILIYKNKEGNKPVLWKQLPGGIKKITDKSVSPNIKYTYQLKAILKNSAYSTIEVVNITY
ncbi:fibronectin type III domain-containing protein [Aquimarina sediminis]|uniref:hypothetical protein n=1 Tax=Aquimarina sediminis TaxID=2070536 RepID=UPI000CA03D16|nr:hypothetical protein [Aquimarina sediminis]